ncbi:tRNA uridine-5-carboxymethylaminomethyl(34) synthesis GTPase MnmE [Rickettsiales bacterium]|nr:tRNA uridine-5-carboxymethylaminomethyl(34) synthesis GTPase MnmE [Rickettsiales bacterium]
METIYAPATAIAKSGVCVIRVSGQKAKDCVEILSKKPLPKARYTSLRDIFNPKTNELIDSALIIYFSSPNSFTGEDVVEFHTHGSRAVVNSLLEALSEIKDFRLAEPGEFSKRAFENSKMNLVEAEGLSDLINAETKSQAQLALRQMQGSLSELYNQWRQEILQIRSLVEAYIDFPDEEIPQNIIEQTNLQIENLKTNIRNHLDDNNRGEKLRDGIYITLIGEPNVGKSSLLNNLSKRDMAMVSDIEGTTRDIIEVPMDIGGFSVTISDTAGIRNSSDILEIQGISRTLDRSKNSDLKIAILDCSKNLEFPATIKKEIDNKTIIVINKCDIKKDIKETGFIKDANPIYISVKTGQGVDKLLNEIESRVKDIFYDMSSPLVTRNRHRELSSKALEYLNNTDLSDPPEMSAEHLRGASTEIGKIIGAINTDEVLGHIFGQFCIGK